MNAFEEFVTEAEKIFEYILCRKKISERFYPELEQVLYELLTPELLESSDAIIILAPHSSFDYQLIVEHSKIIFDTKNTLSRIGISSSSSVEIVRL